MEKRPSSPYGNNRTPSRNPVFTKPKGSFQGRPSFSRPKKFQSRDKFAKPERYFYKPGPELAVIAGKFHDKLLENWPSPMARVTPRRVRDAIFSTLYRRTRFSRFLDLYARGGATGFEALSRGAQLCTFVERRARLASVLKRNMDQIGIKEGHAEIFQFEPVPFLRRMAKRKREWDIIFVSPPYDADYNEVLELLGSGACVSNKRGIVVIEHHADMFFPEVIGSLHRFRVLEFDGVGLSFYDRRKTVHR